MICRVCLRHPSNTTTLCLRPNLCAAKPRLKALKRRSEAWSCHAEIYKSFPTDFNRNRTKPYDSGRKIWEYSFTALYWMLNSRIHCCQPYVRQRLLRKDSSFAHTVLCTCCSSVNIYQTMRPFLLAASEALDKFGLISCCQCKPPN